MEILAWKFRVQGSKFRDRSSGLEVQKLGGQRLEVLGENFSVRSSGWEFQCWEWNFNVSSLRWMFRVGTSKLEFQGLKFRVGSAELQFQCLTLRFECQVWTLRVGSAGYRVNFQGWEVQGGFCSSGLFLKFESGLEVEGWVGKSGLDVQGWISSKWKVKAGTCTCWMFHKLEVHLLTVHK